MSWLFDDDISWCGNSEYCGITECFRHLNNRRPQPAPDIFTVGLFQNTPDCPYYNLKQEEEK